MHLSGPLWWPMHITAMRWGVSCCCCGLSWCSGVIASANHPALMNIQDWVSTNNVANWALRWNSWIFTATSSPISAEEGGDSTASWQNLPQSNELAIPTHSPRKKIEHAAGILYLDTRCYSRNAGCSKPPAWIKENLKQSRGKWEKWKIMLQKLLRSMMFSKFTYGN